MWEFKHWKPITLFYFQSVCDTYERSEFHKDLVQYAKAVTDSPKLDGIIVSTSFIYLKIRNQHDVTV